MPPEELEAFLNEDPNESAVQFFGRPLYFVLEGELIRPAKTRRELAECLGDGEQRTIAYDEGEDWMVSTVFLPLCHSFRADGTAIVFETMVFGGPLDGYQDRYPTWEAALTGHREMVERVKLALQLQEIAIESATRGDEEAE